MTYTQRSNVEATIEIVYDTITGRDECPVQMLLWGNHQDLLFEASPTVNRRVDPKPFEEAIADLRSGRANLFGPVPRMGEGNKKEHCTAHFDALWVDIDEKEAVWDTAPLFEQVLGTLPDDLRPSATVFTGNRGLHLYWKLADMLPVEQIEHHNKRMAALLGADHCHDRSRILAHPGSLHRETGRPLEIIEFTGEIHPVARLNQLPVIKVEEKSPRPARRRSPKSSGPASEEWLDAADELRCWGDPPEVRLVARLRGIDVGYLRVDHGPGWKRGDQTRSEVEQEITYRLVREGHSDAQIRSVADAGFSKHKEVRGGRGYDYIDRTIRSARRWAYEQGWLTHPEGGRPKKRDANYRIAADAERQGFLELVHGQRLSEWVTEVTDRGKSKQSAYRYKDRLVQEGLIDIRARRIFRL